MTNMKTGQEPDLPRQQIRLPLDSFQSGHRSRCAPDHALLFSTDRHRVSTCCLRIQQPIITGLLEEELGSEEIVLSDWYLITDHVLSGEALPARAWGVEHYSELERTQGVLDAGCDQFGGEVRPELLVQLVEEGKISMDSKSRE
jgi:hypothetical protein